MLGFFFFPTSEICDICICGYWKQTKFPTHKVWWLREAAQIGQMFTPLCEKKFFKTQHGIIPIDPAILVAIGHRFIAKKIHLKTTYWKPGRTCSTSLCSCTDVMPHELSLICRSLDRARWTGVCPPLSGSWVLAPDSNKVVTTPMWLLKTAENKRKYLLVNNFLELYAYSSMKYLHWGYLNLTLTVPNLQILIRFCTYPRGIGLR